MVSAQIPRSHLVVQPDASTNARPRISSGLSYKISREGRPKYWTHSLYHGPDGENVDLQYCRTLKQSEEVAKKFLTEKVVGFDLEWVADNKRRGVKGIAVKLNVSLIQVASETTSALFHIAMHSGTTTAQLIAPSLRRLIESRSILKVGVNILNADAKRLARNFDIAPGGIMELSHLYKVATNPLIARRRNSQYGGLVALACITLDHMHLPLSKDKKIRCGRWDQDLSSSQKKYAADDAYVGFHLYHKMNTDRLNMDKVPQHPRVTDIENVNGEIATVSREYRAPPRCPDIGQQPVEIDHTAHALPHDVQHVVAGGQADQDQDDSIETLDMTGSGAPVLRKLQVSESFTTRTGMLGLEDDDDSDDFDDGVDDSFMTMVSMEEIRYPALPALDADDEMLTNRRDSGNAQEMQSENAIEPFRPLSEDSHLPEVLHSEPLLGTPCQTTEKEQPAAPIMTGLTKRLYSALCALRIRLQITQHPTASDAVLSDLAWILPRSLYELSFAPGGDAFADLLADRDVRLIDFVNKHAPISAS
ncbi:hypothetical protein B0A48_10337 [Cryoendolithus antarcticus]|uniref:3'-5' exonuclease domain-containing protein n=1 Tax=Cryoendolithus antarcticus TaxID=1507870 RepID=A0A1V8SXP0_9PEZI|nr:hypothetical protein B0A48_10337 [Cryoendolithus antarcticus]